MKISTLSLHEAAELEALEYLEGAIREGSATASNGLAGQKLASFMTPKQHEHLAFLREKSRTGQAQLPIAA